MEEPNKLKTPTAEFKSNPQDNYYQRFMLEQKASVAISARVSDKIAVKLFAEGNDYLLKEDYPKALACFINAYQLMKPKLASDFLPDKQFYANLCNHICSVLEELIGKEFKHLDLWKNLHNTHSLGFDKALQAELNQILMKIHGHLTAMLPYFKEIHPLTGILNCYEKQKLNFNLGCLFGGKAKYHQYYGQVSEQIENIKNAIKYFKEALILTPINSKEGRTLAQSCHNYIPLPHFTTEFREYLQYVVPDFKKTAAATTTKPPEPKATPGSKPLHKTTITPELPKVENKAIFLQNFDDKFSATKNILKRIADSEIAIHNLQKKYDVEVTNPDDIKNNNKKIDADIQFFRSTVSFINKKINFCKINIAAAKENAIGLRKLGHELEATTMEAALQELSCRIAELDQLNFNEKFNNFSTLAQKLKQSIEKNEVAHQPKEEAPKILDKKTTDQKQKKNITPKTANPAVKKTTSKQRKKENFQRAKSEAKDKKYVTKELSKAEIKKNLTKITEKNTPPADPLAEPKIEIDKLQETNPVNPEKEVKDEKCSPLSAQTEPSSTPIFNNLPSEFNSNHLAGILTADKLTILGKLINLKRDLKELSTAFPIPLSIRGTFILECAAYLLKRKNFKAADIDGITELSVPNEITQFYQLLIDKKHAFKCKSSDSTYYNFIYSQEDIKIDITAKLPAYPENYNPFLLTALKMDISIDEKGIIHFHLDRTTKKLLNNWIKKLIFPVELPLADEKNNVRHFFTRLQNIELNVMAY